MSVNKNIEFLQSRDSRSIKSRLEASLKKCSSLKGSVAFWKIRTGYIKGLVNVLNHHDSFICVDIHQPTNIDCLDEFVKQGANVYLFLYRVDTGRHPLLHTKLLLLDFPDGKAEIWIGSQNFTHSAIKGNNLESTSIISIEKNSALYRQVSDYIHFIRECCEDIGIIYFSYKLEKFNRDLIEFYKKLQNTYDRQETNYKVLDVVCNSVDTIHDLSERKDECTLIMAFDSSHLRQFAGKEIVIRALDSQKEVVCYRAKVHSVGDITPVHTIGDVSSEDEETLVKTYTNEKGHHYQIKSCIVQYNGMIPVFVSKPPNVTNQSVSLIVSITKKLQGDLLPSQKGNFWKNIPKKMRVKNLTYLQSISKGTDGEEKVVVQIPRSPDFVKTESTYPFDKIKDRDDLSEIIEQLYLISTNSEPSIYTWKEPLLKDARLTKKQTIIRNLVIGKDKSRAIRVSKTQEELSQPSFGF